MSARAAMLAVALLAGCHAEAPVSEESRAREAFVRQLAEREGLLDVWSLMSRNDLVFDEGVAPLAMAPPRSSMPWTHVAPPPPERGIATRWIGARTLLRVRGTGDHHLAVRGWVDLERVFTRPRIEVTFDGREVASALVATDGTFLVEAPVPAAWLRGWSSIYITLSSVSEPWRDPADLAVARLEGVTWEPADRPPGRDATP